MTLLCLKDVTTHYGKICALKGISLEIEPGEIVCLIGANGAGKTTTLKTICGLLKVSQGMLRYMEHEITNLPTHRVAALGIALVPEGRQVFARMSVEENLEMGAYLSTNRAEITERSEAMMQLFPRLRERHRQAAGTLSGGEQQMLAIARALMARPELLLLDEPSMGLAPNLLDGIFQSILEINRKGTAVLLVEQNTHIALEIAQRGYILQTGSILLSGSSAELKGNDLVRQAYLGMN